MLLLFGAVGLRVDQFVTYSDGSSLLGSPVAAHKQPPWCVGQAHVVREQLVDLGVGVSRTTGRPMLHARTHAHTHTHARTRMCVRAWIVHPVFDVCEMKV